jgi:hypothetical protein
MGPVEILQYSDLYVLSSGTKQEGTSGSPELGLDARRR